MTTAPTLFRASDRASRDLSRGAREPAGLTLYGQVVTGAVLVAEFLKYVGADVIFGIPGGASLPLNDALTEGVVDGAFRYVLTGHEQGAAFEAAGYAEATGKVGFCTATSGPGATNLLTGLADAYRDRRAVFALTGNASTTDEPEAFQGLDIVGMTHGRATKASFRPERAADVQEILTRAYHAAITGRPGSVLVDLPKDVQRGTTTMRPWEDVVAAFDWDPPPLDEALLERAAELLRGAERPLLYVGHGAVLANAHVQVAELSRRFDVPVVTTLHALGIVPSADPINLGLIGMHGTVVANLAAHRADVILAVGARFDDRVVTARPDLWAAGARIVQIDVDAEQLNRVRAVDLAIHADVRDALQSLLDRLDPAAPAPDRGPWRHELERIRAAMPIASYDSPTSDALTHEYVYATVAAALRQRGITDVVATFDVGTHQMKGAQWFPVDRPRSSVTSGGMGSMGCALPLATGAAVGRPDATVIAAVGDGGFVMSMHELDPIGAYHLPVKILLFDDAHLGMVTNWHHLFFEGRELTSDRRRGRSRVPVEIAELRRVLTQAVERASTTDELASVVGEAARALAGDEWPAFALAAASFGIPAERVHTKEQLRSAVHRMLAADGPYLLHLELATPSQVYPLIPPGGRPRDIIWKETFPGSGDPVSVRERYDFETGELR